MIRDIHEYLAELDGIPGTRVFTARRARQGYWMNQFAMSLMDPLNRERWRAGERAYVDEWPMREDQKQAILGRDYNRCLDLGANIYFLAKLFASDRLPFVDAVATMTGMSVDEYKAMMLAGGRPPDGGRAPDGGM